MKRLRSFREAPTGLAWARLTACFWLVWLCRKIAPMHVQSVTLKYELDDLLEAYKDDWG